MKKIVWISIILTTALFSLSSAINNISSERPSSKNLPKDILSANERKELTECIANIFWANLSNYYPHYDFEILLAKLEELSKSQTKLENPHDCQLANFLTLLSKINAYDAAKSLETANRFLANLKNEEGINEVIKNKLYYEDLHAGADPVITISESPTLNYREFKLNEELQEVQTSFRTNITIELKDTIQGFAYGVAGMKIGGRRKIYVHPDLAYGKAGGPQELIIFEVEIIRK